MTAIKLTEPERALLARAAAAEDGFADPFEGEAKLTPGLVRRRLMTRASGGEGPERFMVTTKGRSAIEPTEGLKTPRARKPKTLAAAGPACSAPSGKLGIVASLLERPQGATIAELAGATGWQAHSIRGAMSGALKKQRKLNVVSVKTDGVRTYRIEASVGG